MHNEIPVNSRVSAKMINHKSAARDSHAEHPIRVPRQGLTALPRREVPDADGLVRRPRHRRRAVAGDGHAEHRIRVPRQGLAALPRRFDTATKLWTPWPKYDKHPVTLDQLVAELPPDELGRYIMVKKTRGALKSAKLSDAGVRFIIQHGNLSHFG